MGGRKERAIKSGKKGWCAIKPKWHLWKRESGVACLSMSNISGLQCKPGVIIKNLLEKCENASR